MEKERMFMRFFKWIVLAAVILAGVAWWNSSRISVPEMEQDKPVDKITGNDWVLGSSQGLIQVIEYSDYQCPACKFYSNFGQELTKMYGDRVGFAYRHFPLREIHPQANLAAQAAEAAGKQGKFWEMSEVIFAGQEHWAENREAGEFFATYAQELSLDVGKFKTDLNSREVETLVEADYLSAIINKINATPTFFINGQRMNNLRGPDDLLARVELALQQATESAQPEE